MNQWMKYLGLISLGCLLNVKAVAQEGFIESSIGVSFHRIELGDDTQVVSTGEYFSLSVGSKMKHTLSLSGSLRLWNTEEDDQGDAVEHALFHDFHFTGISLGLDAQFFLPALAEGPYLKGGRHCWTANVREVFDIWSGSGCSNLVGAGFLVKGANASKGAYFGEVLLTRFQYVHSWMLVGGVRF
jgi:hypothetical protein